MDKAVYKKAHSLIPPQLAYELEVLLDNTSIPDLHAVVQSSFRDRCLLRAAQLHSLEDLEGTKLLKKAFPIAAVEDYYLLDGEEVPSVGAIILLLDILPFHAVAQLAHSIYDNYKPQEKVFNSRSSHQRTKLLHRCVDYVSLLVLTKEITASGYREFREEVDRGLLFEGSFVTVAVKLLLDAGVSAGVVKKIANEIEWQQIELGAQAAAKTISGSVSHKPFVGKKNKDEASVESITESEEESITESEEESITESEEEKPKQTLGKMKKQQTILDKTRQAKQAMLDRTRQAKQKKPKKTKKVEQYLKPSEEFEMEEADENITDAVMDHIKKPSHATLTALKVLSFKNRIVLKYETASGTENMIFLNKYTINRVSEILMGKNAKLALSGQLGEYLQDVFVDKIDTIEVGILV